MPSRLPPLRHTALTALASLTLATLPTTLDAQRPRMPRVRSEPCEGYCNKVWASCTRVSLRAEPKRLAPVAAVLDSGLRVTVLDGQQRTISPGLVVVERTFTLVEQQDTPEDGRISPPNPLRWRLHANDTVYVVDRESDGDSFANFVWSYRGREATTAKFWPDPEEGDEPNPNRPVRLLAPMTQERWLQVRGPRGETGWARPGVEWTGTSYYDDRLEKCAR